MLIFHLDPARLRILCAIAFCTGQTALFFGFRRSRKQPTESANPEHSKPDSNSETPGANPTVESADSTPQVIRLSLPPVANRSVEMSQQERVAAALIRAGISSPASWTEASSPIADNTPSAKSESASEFRQGAIVPPRHYIKSSSPKQFSNPPSLGPNLLLVGGAILALASLFLFFRIH